MGAEARRHYGTVSCTAGGHTNGCQGHHPVETGQTGELGHGEWVG